MSMNDLQKPVELSEEDEKQIQAFIKSLNDLCAGKIDNCIHCQMPFDTLEQHGRCVYAYPCGHRQYQGILPEKWKPKKKLHPYLLLQIDREAQE